MVHGVVWYSGVVRNGIATVARGMVWYSGVVRNDTASVARGMGRYAHHCGTALGWETLISLSWTLSTSQKYHHFKHHHHHWVCIKFILHIKIVARNESILGFNILLVISTSHDRL